jgi:hypothetical protein
MKPKAYIGIDPGASGSCVLISETGTTKEIRFSKVTDKEVWRFLEDASYEYECFCTIEQVGAMPGQGVTSMFTFGMNVGKMHGLLIASGIPFEQKVPRSWQKALGITPRFKPKKGESGTEESKPDFKKRLKQKAEQLFPNQKITLDTADGYLIAEYTKRERSAS